MKKTIATVIISALAIIPATSAWAGGGTDQARAQPFASSVLSSPTGGATGDRLWAVGCDGGQAFEVYISPDGSLHTVYWTNGACLFHMHYLKLV